MQNSRAVEVVHSWRVDVQRVRWPQHLPPPPAGLTADCRWLGMELEWIAARYPAAGDLASEVRSLEAELRSLVGDPVATLGRALVDEAFNALFDHCVHRPGCKVDVDSPEPPPTCPEAEALYRAWFILWRREVRR